MKHMRIIVAHTAAGPILDAAEAVSLVLNYYSTFRSGINSEQWQATAILEIPLVVVRRDHVACFIVNANHGIM
jgi:hypothetical protein